MLLLWSGTFYQPTNCSCFFHLENSNTFSSFSTSPDTTPFLYFYRKFLKNSLFLIFWLFSFQSLRTHSNQVFSHTTEAELLLSRSLRTFVLLNPVIASHFSIWESQLHLVSFKHFIHLLPGYYLALVFFPPLIALISFALIPLPLILEGNGSLVLRLLLILLYITALVKSSRLVVLSTTCMPMSPNVLSCSTAP